MLPTWAFNLLLFLTFVNVTLVLLINHAESVTPRLVINFREMLPHRKLNLDPKSVQVRSHTWAIVAVANVASIVLFMGSDDWTFLGAVIGTYVAVRVLATLALKRTQND